MYCIRRVNFIQQTNTKDTQCKVKKHNFIHAHRHILYKRAILHSAPIGSKLLLTQYSCAYIHMYIHCIYMYVVCKVCTVYSVYTYLRVEDRAFTATAEVVSLPRVNGATCVCVCVCVCVCACVCACV